MQVIDKNIRILEDNVRSASALIQASCLSISKLPSLFPGVYTWASFQRFCHSVGASNPAKLV